MTNKINALKDLQEYMKDKYTITRLSKYRDYYAAIGEAIGEMKSVDRIIKKNNELEKALEMAVRDSDKSGTDIWCHDCPYGDDERLNHCWECGIKYYKRKAGID